MRLLFMILIPRLLCDDVNKSDLNAEIPFDKLETMFNQDEKAIETLKNEVASKEIKVKEALEAAQKANKTLAEKKTETSKKQDSLNIVNKPALDIASKIKKADKTIKDLQQSLATLTENKKQLNEPAVLNQIKELKVKIEKALNATRDNPDKIEALKLEVTQADLEKRVAEATEFMESAETLYDGKKIEFETNGCGGSAPKLACIEIGPDFQLFENDWRTKKAKLELLNQELEPKKKAIQLLENEVKDAKKDTRLAKLELEAAEEKKLEIETVKSDWTTKSGELEKANAAKAKLEQDKGALNIDASVQTKEYSDAKADELEADKKAQDASREYEKLENELTGLKADLESKEKLFGVLSEKYETAKRENAATTKVSLFPFYIYGAVGIAIFAAATGASYLGIRFYKKRKNKIRCDEEANLGTTKVEDSNKPRLSTSDFNLYHRTAEVRAVMSDPVVKIPEEANLEKPKVDEGPNLNDTQVRLKLQEEETRENLKLIRAPGAPYTNNPTNDTSVETVHKDEAMITAITMENRGTSTLIMAVMSDKYTVEEPVACDATISNILDKIRKEEGDESTVVTKQDETTKETLTSCSGKAVALPGGTPDREIITIDTAKQEENAKKTENKKTDDKVKKPESNKKNENVKKPENQKTDENVKKPENQKTDENVKKPDNNKKNENVKKPANNGNNTRAKRRGWNTRAKDSIQSVFYYFFAAGFHVFNITGCQRPTATELRNAEMIMDDWTPDSSSSQKTSYKKKTEKASEKSKRETKKERKEREKQEIRLKFGDERKADMDVRVNILKKLWGLEEKTASSKRSEKSKKTEKETSARSRRSSRRRRTRTASPHLNLATYMLSRSGDDAVEHGSNEILAVLDAALNIFKREKSLRFVDHAVIVGDIHGDFNAMKQIFGMFNNGDEPGFLNKDFLFMGDYVDRGGRSVDVMITLLCLKVWRPHQFTLLRGNHETEHVNFVYGFREECLKRFGKKDGLKIWKKFNEVFSHMPIGAIVADEIIVMHGGLTDRMNSIQDILNVKKPIVDVHKDPIVSSFLWADPAIGKGIGPNNSRGGISHTFAEDVLDEQLKRLKCKRLVRGHQVAMNGFHFFHNLKGIIIFSAPNYKTALTSIHNRGAVLEVDKNKKLHFHVFSSGDQNGKRVPWDDINKLNRHYEPLDIHNPNQEMINKMKSYGKNNAKQEEIEKEIKEREEPMTCTLADTKFF